MRFFQAIKRPPWRTVAVGICLLAFVCGGYIAWSPGLDVRNGRDDRGHNGIWISHGWLAGDDWFVANGRTAEISKYRSPKNIKELARKLREHHITDVFPHLCPAELDGSLPIVDNRQVERFLDEFSGFRVIPWIGGPNGSNARLHVVNWRKAFTTNACTLMAQHPRLAGVQINVEPLPNGDANFLKLLEELRAAMPPGKVLSVAAYPPPTRWHPYSDFHWDEPYFREVARRTDQMAVMMYDVGQRVPKLYQHLMRGWTAEVLAWSDRTPVLLGIPTYDDAGAAYHYPQVENITNAILGIHRGLSKSLSSTNYQGVAIYCEWETSAAEWTYLEDHFLEKEVYGHENHSDSRR